jgi:hypothetical protein
MLLFMYLFHLFWRANQFESLKIAGVCLNICLNNCSFHEGRTFSVVNEVFPMVWRTPWKNAAGPACRRNEAASCAEGKGVAATVAPSSHILFVGN